MFGWIQNLNRRSKVIPLGSRVRDIYTGFEGTLVGRTQWLHGCARLTIEPTKLKEDGTLPDSLTFDEPRVELVREEPVRRSKDSSDARPGGPVGAAPARRADVRR